MLWFRKKKRVSSGGKWKKFSALTRELHPGHEKSGSENSKPIATRKQTRSGREGNGN